MNKQEKIAVALLFAAMLGYMVFILPRFAPAPQPKPSPPLNQPTTQTTPTLAPTTQTPGTQPAPSTKPLAPETPAKPEETVHLKNKFIDVELTTHGAAVKRIHLLKYEIQPNGTGSKKQPVILNQYGGIPALALENVENGGSNVSYEIRQSESSVVFERITPSGLKIRKTYSLAQGDDFEAASDYTIRCQVSFEAPKDRAISIKAPGLTAGTAAQRSPEEGGIIWMLFTMDNRGIYLRVDSFDGTEPKYHFLTEIESTPVTTIEPLPLRWLAIKNQYFAMILTPDRPGAGSTRHQLNLNENELPKGMLAKAVTGSLYLSDINIEAGKTDTRDFVYYAGPKEYKRLLALSNHKEFGHHQDEVMQFGQLFAWQLSWLSAICKSMLLGVLWFHSLVGNFGVAIILVTLLIRAIFWPLTGYGARQMKKMQALQPEIKAIRDKYAEDQMKLYQETQKLMKKNHVNQFGGCLPALVQIPFFAAFYSILISATELWGAKFLWVGDLAAPDGIFYVAGFRFDLLLILMAATQVWQAKQTPSTDPMQAKMAMFMPLVMVLMMYAWKFSAALVLYWTVGNLITIAQNYMTKLPTASPRKTPT